MNVYFYLALLAASCGYALWRGDRDARVAAIVCIVATALTVLLLTPGRARYQLVESGAMIVDLATLAAFVTLALYLAPLLAAVGRGAATDRECGACAQARSTPRWSRSLMPPPSASGAIRSC